MYFGDNCPQFSRTLHAEEVAFVFDIPHAHSKLGTIVVVVGLEAEIVELVDGTSRITPQFPQIGRVILIHFLCETYVVVATDTASLVLAKENWPLVLPDSLVVFTESARVPLEVDERVLVGLKRGVNCSSSFLFVDPSLVHNGMHHDIVVQLNWSLLHYHLFHLLMLILRPFLIRL